MGKSSDSVSRTVHDALQRDYLDLQDRFYKLELSFYEQDRGHGVAVDYLQRELSKREAENAQLKTEIGKLKIAVEDERQHMLKEVELKRNEVESERERLNQDVEQLRQQLQSLTDYKEHKEKYDQDVVELRQQMIDHESNLKEQVQYLEDSFLKANKKKDQKHSESLAKIENLCQQKAEQLLKKLYKNMVEQNVQLAEDLRFHVEHSQDLEKRAEEAERKLSLIQRDQWSETAIIDTQVKKSQEDERKISSLNNKISQLERQVSELIAKAEDSRKQDVDKLQALLEELTLENDALKRLLKFKSQKLVKIKTIAEHLIDQRSAVEQFLLDHLLAIQDSQKPQPNRRSSSPFVMEDVEFIDKKVFEFGNFDYKSLSFTEKEVIIRKLLNDIQWGKATGGRSSSMLPMIQS
ncbi:hypothetical protein P9112_006547 [Eukaryota sp. TZLM1-RC]